MEEVERERDSEEEPTTLEEVREILESFYNVYYPQKLNSINLILEKYDGNYDRLLLQLRDKYKEFLPIYDVHMQRKRSKTTATSKRSISKPTSTSNPASAAAILATRNEVPGSEGNEMTSSSPAHLASDQHRNQKKGQQDNAIEMGPNHMVTTSDASNDESYSNGTASGTIPMPSKGHPEGKGSSERPKTDSSSLISSFISKVAESVSDDPRTRRRPKEDGSVPVATSSSVTHALSDTDNRCP